MENDFSYAGVCQDSVTQNMLQDAANKTFSIRNNEDCRGVFWSWLLSREEVPLPDKSTVTECYATDDAFAVQAEISVSPESGNTPEYFCVDSTGFAGSFFEINPRLAECEKPEVSN